MCSRFRIGAIMALAVFLLLVDAAIRGVDYQRRRKLIREAVPIAPRAGAMLVVTSVTLVAPMAGLWSMRVRG